MHSCRLDKVLLPALGELCLADPYPGWTGFVRTATPVELGRRAPPRLETDRTGRETGMGVWKRLPALGLAIVSGLGLAGCGSSVADSDFARPSATPTPTSPFCAAVRANVDALRPLNAMISGGARPPDVRAAVDAARRTGAQLVQVAPTVIADDVARVIGVVNVQLDALVAHDGDGAALTRDPALQATVHAPGVTDSARRYSTYVDQNCPVTPR